MINCKIIYTNIASKVRPWKRFVFYWKRFAFYWNRPLVLNLEGDLYRSDGENETMETLCV